MAKNYTEVVKGSGASPNNPIPTANQYGGYEANQPNQAHRDVNPNQYAKDTVKPDYRDSIESKQYREEQEENNKKRERILKDYEAGRSERAAAKEKKEKEHERMIKKRQKKIGLEIPKQGLHRMGYAARDLSPSMGGFRGSDNAAGYGDSFSIGSEFINMRPAKPMKSGVGFGVNFGAYADPFSGKKQTTKKRKPGRPKGSMGKGGGLPAGYQSPFQGMIQRKETRGRKPKSIAGWKVLRW